MDGDCIAMSAEWGAGNKQSTTLRYYYWTGTYWAEISFSAQMPLAHWHPVGALTNTVEFPGVRQARTTYTCRLIRFRARVRHRTTRPTTQR